MTIKIRPIKIEDAPAYNAYRRSIADEPHNKIASIVGEYTRSVEAERERIAGVIADPNQQILLAIAEGNICGQCMCRGSHKVVLRHAVVLGIDVAEAYRGQGVGSALMAEMLQWADENPQVTRVELDVFATNRPAISLYLKYGFYIEGRRRNAYLKDGTYTDSYVMGLLLKNGQ